MDAKNEAHALRQRIEEREDEVLFLDATGEYDEALVGVGNRCGMRPVVIYSTRRVVDILVRGGMTEEEAIEFFDFNIGGAWVGEQTPMFLDDLEPLALDAE